MAENVLERKLAEMDQALMRLDKELENITDESQRPALQRMRDAMERIRDASRPGAPTPSPEQARLFLDDVFLIKQIALAQNIKPSVC
ncbi:hypothetical protein QKT49_gp287 [Acanthamoeba castellanii medusavirus]|uniref:Uncharacterized protein n=1 Tax=Acanthamoeba castellanii medusavirus J1 TaxID=3114988 RepID=A0A3T1CXC2_9VIRU|nr:hypothetical protein QKT49_gp287 [Acanthamoeba castellanii medusavirus]BBI30476.1 hypothetical protein [Acanthamoeba castellanii medusavirus J1]